MTDGEDPGWSSVEYHLKLAIETIGYHRAYMGLLAEQIETLIDEHEEEGAVPVGEIAELAASLRTALSFPLPNEGPGPR